MKASLAERKVAFIEHLAQTSNVTLSAHLAGWVRRNTAYQHREKDPLFAELWQEAIDIATDELESAARSRAIGWDEPIVNKDGEVVGQRRVYSDKMMEMMLKAHRPDKYRDKQDIDLNHKGGIILMPKPFSEEEWEAQAGTQQKEHRERNHG